jgi:predicted HTH transcriptional regulator
VNQKELLQMISEGEHVHQDFKFAITDTKKIARSIAAFANTEGGRLLIGVKDNGKIAGVESDEEYYMIEAAANIYCKPAIPFMVKTWNDNFFNSL